MPETSTASMTPKPVPIPSATDEAMSLDDAAMTSVFWLIATIALVLLAAWLTVAPGAVNENAPPATRTASPAEDDIPSVPSTPLAGE